MTKIVLIALALAAGAAARPGYGGVGFSFGGFSPYFGFGSHGVSSINVQNKEFNVNKGSGYSASYSQNQKESQGYSGNLGLGQSGSYVFGFGAKHGASENFAGNHGVSGIQILGQSLSLSPSHIDINSSPINSHRSYVVSSSHGASNSLGGNILATDNGQYTSGSYKEATVISNNNRDDINKIGQGIQIGQSATKSLEGTHNGESIDSRNEKGASEILERGTGESIIQKKSNNQASIIIDNQVIRNNIGSAITVNKIKDGSISHGGGMVETEMVVSTNQNGGANLGTGFSVVGSEGHYGVSFKGVSESNTEASIIDHKDNAFNIETGVTEIENEGFKESQKEDINSQNTRQNISNTSNEKQAISFVHGIKKHSSSDNIKYSKNQTINSNLKISSNEIGSQGADISIDRKDITAQHKEDSLSHDSQATSNMTKANTVVNTKYNNQNIITGRENHGLQKGENETSRKISISEDNVMDSGNKEPNKISRLDVAQRKQGARGNEKSNNNGTMSNNKENESQAPGDIITLNYKEQNKNLRNRGNARYNHRVTNSLVTPKSKTNESTLIGENSKQGSTSSYKTRKVIPKQTISSLGSSGNNRKQQSRLEEEIGDSGFRNSNDKNGILIKNITTEINQGALGGFKEGGLETQGASITSEKGVNASDASLTLSGNQDQSKISRFVVSHRKNSANRNEEAIASGFRSHKKQSGSQFGTSSSFKYQHGVSENQASGDTLSLIEKQQNENQRTRGSLKHKHGETGSQSTTDSERLGSTFENESSNSGRKDINSGFKITDGVDISQLERDAGDGSGIQKGSGVVEKETAYTGSGIASKHKFSNIRLTLSGNQSITENKEQSEGAGLNLGTLSTTIDHGNSIGNKNNDESQITSSGLGLSEETNVSLSSAKFTKYNQSNNEDFSEKPKLSHYEGSVSNFGGQDVNGSLHLSGVSKVDKGFSHNGFAYNSYSEREQGSDSHNLNSSSGNRRTFNNSQSSSVVTSESHKQRHGQSTIASYDESLSIKNSQESGDGLALNESSLIGENGKQGSTSSYKTRKVIQKQNTSSLGSSGNDGNQQSSLEEVIGDSRFQNSNDKYGHSTYLIYNENEKVNNKNSENPSGILIKNITTEITQGALGSFIEGGLETQGASITSEGGVNASDASLTLSGNQDQSKISRFVVSHRKNSANRNEEAIASGFRSHKKQSGSQFGTSSSFKYQHGVSENQASGDTLSLIEKQQNENQRTRGSLKHKHGETGSQSTTDSERLGSTFENESSNSGRKDINSGFKITDGVDISQLERDAGDGSGIQKGSGVVEKETAYTGSGIASKHKFSNIRLTLSGNQSITENKEQSEGAGLNLGTLSTTIDHGNSIGNKNNDESQITSSGLGLSEETNVSLSSAKFTKYNQSNNEDFSEKPKLSHYEGSVSNFGGQDVNGSLHLSGVSKVDKGFSHNGFAYNSYSEREQGSDSHNLNSSSGNRRTFNNSQSSSVVTSESHKQRHGQSTIASYDESLSIKNSQESGDGLALNESSLIGENGKQGSTSSYKTRKVIQKQNTSSLGSSGNDGNQQSSLEEVIGDSRFQNSNDKYGHSTYLIYNENEKVNNKNSENPSGILIKNITTEITQGALGSFIEGGLETQGASITSEGGVNASDASLTLSGNQDQSKISRFVVSHRKNSANRNEEAIASGFRSHKKQSGSQFGTSSSFKYQHGVSENQASGDTLSLIEKQQNENQRTRGSLKHKHGETGSQSTTDSERLGSTFENESSNSGRKDINSGFKITDGVDISQLERDAGDGSGIQKGSGVVEKETAYTGSGIASKHKFSNIRLTLSGNQSITENKEQSEGAGLNLGTLSTTIDHGNSIGNKNNDESQITSSGLGLSEETNVSLSSAKFTKYNQSNNEDFSEKPKLSHYEGSVSNFGGQDVNGSLHLSGVSKVDKGFSHNGFAYNSYSEREQGSDSHNLNSSSGNRRTFNNSQSSSVVTSESHKQRHGQSTIASYDESLSIKNSQESGDGLALNESSLIGENGKQGSTSSYKTRKVIQKQNTSSLGSSGNDGNQQSSLEEVIGDSRFQNSNDKYGHSTYLIYNENEKVNNKNSENPSGILIKNITTEITQGALGSFIEGGLETQGASITSEGGVNASDASLTLSGNQDQSKISRFVVSHRKNSANRNEEAIASGFRSHKKQSGSQFGTSSSFKYQHGVSENQASGDTLSLIEKQQNENQRTRGSLKHKHGETGSQSTTDSERLGSTFENESSNSGRKDINSGFKITDGVDISQLERDAGDGSGIQKGSGVVEKETAYTGSGIASKHKFSNIRLTLSGNQSITENKEQSEGAGLNLGTLSTTIDHGNSIGNKNNDESQITSSGLGLSEETNVSLSSAKFTKYNQSNNEDFSEKPKLSHYEGSVSNFGGQDVNGSLHLSGVSKVDKGFSHNGFAYNSYSEREQGSDSHNLNSSSGNRRTFNNSQSSSVVTSESHKQRHGQSTIASYDESLSIKNSQESGDGLALNESSLIGENGKQGSTSSYKTRKVIQKQNTSSLGSSGNDGNQQSSLEEVIGDSRFQNSNDKYGHSTYLIYNENEKVNNKNSENPSGILIKNITTEITQGALGSFIEGGLETQGASITSEGGVNASDASLTLSGNQDQSKISRFVVSHRKNSANRNEEAIASGFRSHKKQSGSQFGTSSSFKYQHGVSENQASGDTLSLIEKQQNENQRTRGSLKHKHGETGSQSTTDSERLGSTFENESSNSGRKDINSGFKITDGVDISQLERDAGDGSGIQKGSGVVEKETAYTGSGIASKHKFSNIRLTLSGNQSITENKEQSEGAGLNLGTLSTTIDHGNSIGNKNNDESQITSSGLGLSEETNVSLSSAKFTKYNQSNNEDFSEKPKLSHYEGSVSNFGGQDVNGSLHLSGVSKVDKGFSHNGFAYNSYSEREQGSDSHNLNSSSGNRRTFNNSQSSSVVTSESHKQRHGQSTIASYDESLSIKNSQESGDGLALNESSLIGENGKQGSTSSYKTRKVIQKQNTSSLGSSGNDGNQQSSLEEVIGDSRFQNSNDKYGHSTYLIYNENEKVNNKNSENPSGILIKNITTEITQGALGSFIEGGLETQGASITSEGGVNASDASLTLSGNQDQSKISRFVVSHRKNSANRNEEAIASGFRSHKKQSGSQFGTSSSFKYQHGVSENQASGDTLSLIEKQQNENQRTRGSLKHKHGETGSQSTTDSERLGSTFENESSNSGRKDINSGFKITDGVDISQLERDAGDGSGIQKGSGVVEKETAYTGSGIASKHKFSNIRLTLSGNQSITENKEQSEGAGLNLGTLSTTIDHGNSIGNKNNDESQITSSGLGLSEETNVSLSSAKFTKYNQSNNEDFSEKPKLSHYEGSVSNFGGQDVNGSLHLNGVSKVDKGFSHNGFAYNSYSEREQGSDNHNLNSSSGNRRTFNNSQSSSVVTSESHKQRHGQSTIASYDESLSIKNSQESGDGLALNESSLIGENGKQGSTSSYKTRKVIQKQNTSSLGSSGNDGNQQSSLEEVIGDSRFQNSNDKYGHSTYLIYNENEKVNNKNSENPSGILIKNITTEITQGALGSFIEGGLETQGASITSEGGVNASDASLTLSGNQDQSKISRFVVSHRKNSANRNEEAIASGFRSHKKQSGSQFGTSSSFKYQHGVSENQASGDTLSLIEKQQNENQRTRGSLKHKHGETGSQSTTDSERLGSTFENESSNSGRKDINSGFKITDGVDISQLERDAGDGSGIQKGSGVVEKETAYTGSGIASKHKFSNIRLTLSGNQSITENKEQSEGAGLNLGTLSTTIDHGNSIGNKNNDESQITSSGLGLSEETNVSLSSAKFTKYNQSNNEDFSEKPKLSHYEGSVSNFGGQDVNGSLHLSGVSKVDKGFSHNGFAYNSYSEREQGSDSHNLNSSSGNRRTFNNSQSSSVVTSESHKQRHGQSTIASYDESLSIKNSQESGDGLALNESSLIGENGKQGSTSSYKTRKVIQKQNTSSLGSSGNDGNQQSSLEEVIGDSRFQNSNDKYGHSTYLIYNENEKVNNKNSENPSGILIKNITTEITQGALGSFIEGGLETQGASITSEGGVNASDASLTLSGNQDQSKISRFVVSHRKNSANRNEEAIASGFRSHKKQSGSQFGTSSSFKYQHGVSENQASGDTLSLIEKQQNENQRTRGSLKHKPGETGSQSTTDSERLGSTFENESSNSGRKDINSGFKITDGVDISQLERDAGDGSGIQKGSGVVEKETAYTGSGIASKHKFSNIRLTLSGNQSITENKEQSEGAGLNLGTLSTTIDHGNSIGNKNNDESQITSSGLGLSEETNVSLSSAKFTKYNQSNNEDFSEKPKLSHYEGSVSNFGGQDVNGSLHLSGVSKVDKGFSHNGFAYNSYSEREQGSDSHNLNSSSGNRRTFNNSQSSSVVTSESHKQRHGQSTIASYDESLSIKNSQESGDGLALNESSLIGENGKQGSTSSYKTRKVIQKQNTSSLGSSGNDGNQQSSLEEVIGDSRFQNSNDKYGHSTYLIYNENEKVNNKNSENPSGILIKNITTEITQGALGSFIEGGLETQGASITSEGGVNASDASLTLSGNQNQSKISRFVVSHRKNSANRNEEAIASGFRSHKKQSGSQFGTSSSFKYQHGVSENQASGDTLSLIEKQQNENQRTRGSLKHKHGETGSQSTTDSERLGSTFENESSNSGRKDINSGFKITDGVDISQLERDAGDGSGIQKGSGVVEKETAYTGSGIASKHKFSNIRLTLSGNQSITENKEQSEGAGLNLGTLSTTIDHGNSIGNKNNDESQITSSGLGLSEETNVSLSSAKFTKYNQSNNEDFSEKPKLSHYEGSVSNFGGQDVNGSLHLSGVSKVDKGFSHNGFAYNSYSEREQGSDSHNLNSSSGNRRTFNNSQSSSVVTSESHKQRHGQSTIASYDESLSIKNSQESGDGLALNESSLIGENGKQGSTSSYKTRKVIQKQNTSSLGSSGNDGNQQSSLEEVIGDSRFQNSNDKYGHSTYLIYNENEKVNNKNSENPSGILIKNITTEITQGALGSFIEGGLETQGASITSEGGVNASDASLTLSGNQDQSKISRFVVSHRKNSANRNEEAIASGFRSHKKQSGSQFGTSSSFKYQHGVSENQASGDTLSLIEKQQNENQRTRGSLKHKHGETGSQSTTDSERLGSTFENESSNSGRKDINSGFKITDGVDISQLERDAGDGSGIQKGSGVVEKETAYTGSGIASKHKFSNIRLTLSGNQSITENKEQSEGAGLNLGTLSTTIDHGNSIGNKNNDESQITSSGLGLSEETNVSLSSAKFTKYNQSNNEDFSEKPKLSHYEGSVSNFGGQDVNGSLHLNGVSKVDKGFSHNGFAYNSYSEREQGSDNHNLNSSSGNRRTFNNSQSSSVVTSESHKQRHGQSTIASYDESLSIKNSQESGDGLALNESSLIGENGKQGSTSSYKTRKVIQKQNTSSLGSSGNDGNQQSSLEEVIGDSRFQNSYDKYGHSTYLIYNENEKVNNKNSENPSGILIKNITTEITQGALGSFIEGGLETQGASITSEGGVNASDASLTLSGNQDQSKISRFVVSHRKNSANRNEEAIASGFRSHKKQSGSQFGTSSSFKYQHGVSENQASGDTLTLIEKQQNENQRTRGSLKHKHGETGSQSTTDSERLGSTFENESSNSGRKDINSGFKITDGVDISQLERDAGDGSGIQKGSGVVEKETAYTGSGIASKHKFSNIRLTLSGIQSITENKEQSEGAGLNLGTLSTTIDHGNSIGNKNNDESQITSSGLGLSEETNVSLSSAKFTKYNQSNNEDFSEKPKLSHYEGSVSNFGGQDVNGSLHLSGVSKVDKGFSHNGFAYNSYSEREQGSDSHNLNSSSGNRRTFNNSQSSSVVTSESHKQRHGQSTIASYDESLSIKNSQESGDGLALNESSLIGENGKQGSTSSYKTRKVIQKQNTSSLGSSGNDGNQQSSLEEVIGDSRFQNSNDKYGHSTYLIYNENEKVNNKNSENPSGILIKNITTEITQGALGSFIEGGLETQGASITSEGGVNASDASLTLSGNQDQSKISRFVVSHRKNSANRNEEAIASGFRSHKKQSGSQFGTSSSFKYQHGVSENQASGDTLSLIEKQQNDNQRTRGSLKHKHGETGSQSTTDSERLGSTFENESSNSGRKDINSGFKITDGVDISQLERDAGDGSGIQKGSGVVEKETAYTGSGIASKHKFSNIRLTLSGNQSITENKEQSEGAGLNLGTLSTTIDHGNSIGNKNNDESQITSSGLGLSEETNVSLSSAKFTKYNQSNNEDFSEKPKLSHYEGSVSNFGGQDVNGSLHLSGVSKVDKGFSHNGFAYNSYSEREQGSDSHNLNSSSGNRRTFNNSQSSSVVTSESHKQRHGQSTIASYDESLSIKNSQESGDGLALNESSLIGENGKQGSTSSYKTRKVIQKQNTSSLGSSGNDGNQQSSLEEVIGDSRFQNSNDKYGHSTYLIYNENEKVNNKNSENPSGILIKNITTEITQGALGSFIEGGLETQGASITSEGGVNASDASLTLSGNQDQSKISRFVVSHRKNSANRNEEAIASGFRSHKKQSGSQFGTSSSFKYQHGVSENQASGDTLSLIEKQQNENQRTRGSLKHKHGETGSQSTTDSERLGSTFENESSNSGRKDINSGFKITDGVDISQLERDAGDGSGIQKGSGVVEKETAYTGSGVASKHKFSNIRLTLSGNQSITENKEQSEGAGLNLGTLSTTIDHGNSIGNKNNDESQITSSGLGLSEETNVSLSSAKFTKYNQSNNEDFSEKPKLSHYEGSVSNFGGQDVNGSLHLNGVSKVDKGFSHNGFAYNSYSEREQGSDSHSLNSSSGNRRTFNNSQSSSVVTSESHKQRHGQSTIASYDESLSIKNSQDSGDGLALNESSLIGENGKQGLTFSYKNQVSDANNTLSGNNGHSNISRFLVYKRKNGGSRNQDFNYNSSMSYKQNISQLDANESYQLRHRINESQVPDDNFSINHKEKLRNQGFRHTFRLNKGITDSQASYNIVSLESSFENRTSNIGSQNISSVNTTRIESATIRMEEGTDSLKTAIGSKGSVAASGKLITNVNLVLNQYQRNDEQISNRNNNFGAVATQFVEINNTLVEKKDNQINNGNHSVKPKNSHNERSSLSLVGQKNNETSGLSRSVYVYRGAINSELAHNLSQSENQKESANPNFSNSFRNRKKNSSETTIMNNQEKSKVNNNHVSGRVFDDRYFQQRLSTLNLTQQQNQSQNASRFLENSLEEIVDMKRGQNSTTNRLGQGIDISNSQRANINFNGDFLLGNVVAGRYQDTNNTLKQISKNTQGTTSLVAADNSFIVSDDQIRNFDSYHREGASRNHESSTINNKLSGSQLGVRRYNYNATISRSQSSDNDSLSLSQKEQKWIQRTRGSFKYKHRTTGSQASDSNQSFGANFRAGINSNKSQDTSSSERGNNSSSAILEAGGSLENANASVNGNQISTASLTLNGNQGQTEISRFGGVQFRRGFVRNKVSKFTVPNSYNEQRGSQKLVSNFETQTPSGARQDTGSNFEEVRGISEGTLAEAVSTNEKQIPDISLNLSKIMRQGSDRVDILQFKKGTSRIQTSSYSSSSNYNKQRESQSGVTGNFGFLQGSHGSLASDSNLSLNQKIQDEDQDRRGNIQFNHGTTGSQASDVNLSLHQKERNGGFALSGILEGPVGYGRSHVSSYSVSYDGNRNVKESNSHYGNLGLWKI